MSLTYKDQADLLVLTNEVNGTTYDKFGKIVGVDFSLSTVAIGTGTKTFTLTGTNGVDRDYKVDDIVVITAKAGATGTMVGKVLLYTPNNRGLSVNVLSITGSGTGTSFRITKQMPRVDYHPVTGEVRGVLIEPTRTNFILTSDTPTGTVVSGTLTQTTVSDLETAPSGNKSVRYLVVTSPAVIRFSNGAGVSNTRYVGSAFIKTKSGPENAVTSAVISTTFNTVNSQNWNINSLGFTRVSATAATANTLRQFEISLPVGEYYLWGVQVETGFKPSSYIPTLSVTESRNTDLIKTINLGPSSAINPLEGTLIVKGEHSVSPEDDARAYTIAALSDGTLSNIISLQLNNQGTASNSARVNVVSAGTNVFTYSTANNLFNLENQYRFGIAYKQNNFYAVFNNTESLVDTAGAVPTGLNTLFIGSSDGVNDLFEGWVSEVIYVPYQIPLEELREIVDSAGNDLLVD